MMSGRGLTRATVVVKALLLVCAIAVTVADASPPKPHIVFVMVDGELRP